jgi:ABC-type lipoprotein release transport system permease subunit
LAAAVVGLGLVAVAASVVPARRAANLDPMAALRDE